MDLRGGKEQKFTSGLRYVEAMALANRNSAPACSWARALVVQRALFQRGRALMQEVPAQSIPMLWNSLRAGAEV